MCPALPRGLLESQAQPRYLQGLGRSLAFELGEFRRQVPNLGGVVIFGGVSPSAADTKAGSKLVTGVAVIAALRVKLAGD